MALQLNVDFSDAGLIPGTSGTKFGDLILFDLLRGKSPLNGLTVRQLLGIAKTALGGGSTIETIDNLDPVVAELNGSFFDGVASTFAQDHLMAPTLPVPVFPYSDSSPWGREEQAPSAAR